MNNIMRRHKPTSFIMSAIGARQLREEANATEFIHDRLSFMPVDSLRISQNWKEVVKQWNQ